jgi:hypothetical protein
VAAYKVGGAGQLGGDDACAMPVLAGVAAGRHPSRDCRRWPETDLEGWRANRRCGEPTAVVGIR